SHDLSPVHVGKLCRVCTACIDSAIDRCDFHSLFVFFFCIHTAPPDIYTLSLHDALPIFGDGLAQDPTTVVAPCLDPMRNVVEAEDRKSTRLNSSHSQISYAVFCLKKKTHTRLNHPPAPAHSAPPPPTRSHRRTSPATPAN